MAPVGAEPRRPSCHRDHLSRHTHARVPRPRSPLTHTLSRSLCGCTGATRSRRVRYATRFSRQAAGSTMYYQSSV
eukprot:4369006-Prymnesium_polylepis.1